MNNGYRRKIQDKGIDNIFNKITENFPILENKKTLPFIQVQEAVRTPNRKDQKKTSHVIIVKTLGIQNKERILKAKREKQQVTYKGKPIRNTTDFLTENLKTRKAWNDVFQALKQNKYQPNSCTQQSYHL
jgi:hypothetical protein